MDGQVTIVMRVVAESFATSVARVYTDRVCAE